MNYSGELVEPLKQWIELIFVWITELGYWGIMLGLMVEVIPSEIMLSFGGYLVSQGNISFIGAVVFGTIGGVIAQIFVYWIGRYGGRPFLEKYGKYILIHKKHIDVSEQWFHRYGKGVIFTARFIPVVRHAISIPAGMAKIPLSQFTLLTTLAVIPWSIFFIYLGMTLGANWEQIDKIAAPYIVPFIVVSIGLTGAYIAYKIYASRRNMTHKNQDSNSQTVSLHDQFGNLGNSYKMLHHQTIQSEGSKQTIDHIVVGPNGVFCILDHKPDSPNQMYRYTFVIKSKLRRLQLKSDVTAMTADRLPTSILNYPSRVSLDDRMIERIYQCLLQDGNEPCDLLK